MMAVTSLGNRSLSDSPPREGEGWKCVVTSTAMVQHFADEEEIVSDRGSDHGPGTASWNHHVQVANRGERSPSRS